jgi:hypothetical protein
MCVEQRQNRSPRRFRMHLARWGSENPVDFGTRDWYTQRIRANYKPLILLWLLRRRGNPSLSAIQAEKSLFFSTS